MGKLKHIFLTILLVCFAMICFESVASFEIVPADEDPCDIQNNCFVDGEQLTYKVYYNWKFVWIPAGEVYFNLTENDADYIVDIKGQSYPSYDSFFKVRDRYRSVISKKTLLPKMFLRDIKQGNYERYDSMLFDQKEYKVVEYYGKSEASAKAHNYDLGNCSQDLISVLYHLRNRDISKITEGYKLPVSFFFSKRQYNLDVDIIEIGDKKIKGLGKYHTIRARPELITGTVFDENSYMDVWVSNDGNKLPLLIESPVRIGTVKAVLKSCDNLKFPLEQIK